MKFKALYAGTTYVTIADEDVKDTSDNLEENSEKENLINKINSIDPKYWNQFNIKP